MEQGKRKCKILKEIRKRIAVENDIPYEITECKHKGDCAGTCPKCDAELRWLESQLKKREAAGKPVTVEAQVLIKYDEPDDDSHTFNDGRLLGAIDPPQKRFIRFPQAVYPIIFVVIIVFLLIRIASL